MITQGDEKFIITSPQHDAATNRWCVHMERLQISVCFKAHSGSVIRLVRVQVRWLKHGNDPKHTQQLNLEGVKRANLNPAANVVEV